MRITLKTKFAIALGLAGLGLLVGTPTPKAKAKEVGTSPKIEEARPPLKDSAK
jgi:hypothetical protein